MPTESIIRLLLYTINLTDFYHSLMLFYQVYGRDIVF